MGTGADELIIEQAAWERNSHAFGPSHPGALLDASDNFLAVADIAGKDDPPRTRSQQYILQNVVAETAVFCSTGHGNRFRWLPGLSIVL